ncbi:MAG TPA: aminopeptidase N [Gammaproteobacteria bacterium]|nr:aminopeptidase N [Gammaproteobacteria bacterium]
MLNSTPQKTYLKDYTPPLFLIPTVALKIEIHDDHTVVTSVLDISRNPASSDRTGALILNGEELELLELKVNRRVLGEDDYKLDPFHLTIPNVPNTFELETKVRIFPQKNTQLMGLYVSKDGLFTQCEAEGFRRITYFLDRPDVMSIYTTTIHAEKAHLPLLLSNGNLDAEGDTSDSRHWVRWVDPFPKPPYLFAMVAAKLDRLEDKFVTASGRTVELSIFVERGKLDQASFAMQALKSAMRWDEEAFGLELDLNQYMIVAVSDFNMGAMENKGLNIFNTKYVLARADTATDNDFMMLDRVIAHEYFHNWTGNRVTCRDWFQLSLKEGLTVFRDQRYGEDRYSPAVQRIQEVRELRRSQFPEDAGPMAHPVRPSEYMEISNFYTATIYNKGAEIVRMIHTLLGSESFRAGMDLYFERHDGQAVRTEEFINAMQDASNVKLDQFQRWYHQAGTPTITANGTYNPAIQQYTLSMSQSCAQGPDLSENLPFHMPIAVGLLDANGNDMPLHTTDGSTADATSCVLELTNRNQQFHFDNIPEAPIPSILRNFSSPVILKYDYSDTELAHLMAHDSDPFNRWEAGQRLAMNIILKGIDSSREGYTPEFPAEFIDCVARILSDGSEDPAFAAEAMTLPGEIHIAEQIDEVNPDAILSVRTALRKHIADELEQPLRRTYEKFAMREVDGPDPRSAGHRALRNICLSYLMELAKPSIIEQCVHQLHSANNMTETIAALTALANCDCVERKTALDEFYDKWCDDSLVIDKWLTVQTTSRLPDTITQVKALTQHEAFDIKNPNKVRAVIGGFCHGNHAGFHAEDGRGYVFASDQVIALDLINPQIAARLARSFDRWRKFDLRRQRHARTSLERIRAVEGLSKDTFEVISNALAENNTG